MIDPRDWSVSAALNGGDSTRMTAHDVARCQRILVRTDLALGQPVVWRPVPTRRQRLVWAGAQCLLTLYFAAVLGALLLGGSALVRWGVDAVVRLVTGAH